MLRTDELELAVSDFSAEQHFKKCAKQSGKQSGSGESVTGQELAEWWCFTKEDAGLEILDVELLAAPVTEGPR